MAMNRLRDRLTPEGQIALGERLDGGGTGTGPTYAIEVSISPARIQPGAKAIVTLYAKKDGQPIGAGYWAEIQTDNAALSAIPDEVSLGADGRGSFALVANQVTGSAQITASFVVDGVTITSAAATLEVVAQEAPENYPMTGWGRLLFGLESPLAVSLVPRPERLSHQEQLRLYGDDMGLEFASQLENEQIIFIPKSMLE